MASQALSNPIFPAEAGERALQAFLRNRSAATVRAYQSDLEQFQLWLGVHTGGEAARRLLGGTAGEAHELVGAFLQHLRDMTFAPNSIRRKLTSLRALVTAAQEIGIVDWKLRMKAPASRPIKDTRGPGVDVYRRMLELASEREDTIGRRNLAIIRMLHDMALRRGELLELQLEHVDLGTRSLSILGKGREEREILTIPTATADVLQRYLDVRGAQSGPLFLSANDGPMHGSDVYDVVSKLAARAGGRSTPHGLRHLAITRVAEMTGGDVTKVMAFSRHTSVQTVMVYIDAWKNPGGELAEALAGEDV